MKKILMIVVMTLLVFTSCGKSSLEGTWTNEEGEKIIIEDGKLSWLIGPSVFLEGTYSVEDDAILLLDNRWPDGIPFVYKYSISGNKLTLTIDSKGNTAVFTRK